MPKTRDPVSEPEVDFLTGDLAAAHLASAPELSPLSAGRQDEGSDECEDVGSDEC